MSPNLKVLQEFFGSGKYLLHPKEWIVMTIMTVAIIVPTLILMDMAIRNILHPGIYKRWGECIMIGMFIIVMAASILICVILIGVGLLGTCITFCYTVWNEDKKEMLR